MPMIFRALGKYLQSIFVVHWRRDFWRAEARKLEI
jgi:hypothetical protein